MEENFIEKLINNPRQNKRIVYSNDGLMFATYDHYQTFYEIIQ